MTKPAVSNLTRKRTASFHHQNKRDEVLDIAERHSFSHRSEIGMFFATEAMLARANISFRSDM
ncbi:MAG: hypothetical protein EA353_09295 [Puniceicoccaceae bacterium]|nr:MAG: hypothetical protein EA353_09295 [Puniceicoccaceae bacterium]